MPSRRAGPAGRTTSTGEAEPGRGRNPGRMGRDADGACSAGAPAEVATTPARGRVPCTTVDGIEHPARLTVGVVGAGRVGAVLGAALARSGHRVTGVYAVSAASRERAATLLPGVPVADVPTVVAGAELVVLAVPDDALGDLSRASPPPGPGRPGRSSCTRAGRHGAAVLDPARRQHALPLALHPAMTFTGTAMDLDRLAECAFGVTADAGAAPGRGGPGPGDGRHPGLGGRGGPRRLPRGARARGEPPRHTGERGDGGARPAPASSSPTASSAR